MTSHLTLCPQTGAILGFSSKGRDRVVPSSRAFQIALLNNAGERRILSSHDFTFIKRGDTLFYEGGGEFSPLRVSLETREEAGAWYFRPSVRNVPPGWILEWIDAPEICVSSRGNLFYPAHEGAIVTEPDRREKYEPARYHPLGYPRMGIGYGGLYPGRCQMQFLAFYPEEGHGVYFGAHDPAHGVKGVEYEFLGDNRTRLSLQTFCSGVRDYVSPFEYILAPFEGDWMDACDIYRSWLPELPPPNLPAWFEESPVLLIYAVRGDGDDRGDLPPNEYFPYANALPAVDRLASAFDSQVMPLLMHWEGTAPWAPPYVWPPFGGEKTLAEFRDALHARGHLLGLYCSGSAWTQTSSITDYSREGQFLEENLEKHMIRGPQGEIDAAVCTGIDAQRLGYDLCLTEEWSRQTVKEEILKLARFGVDYAQFFDQNHGGCFHLCYSRKHRHPPAPGPWQVTAMRSLLREVLAQIRSAGSDLILGCESAAADPHVAELPFSDARPTFAMGHGQPVPAHAFVYHHQINNFMGNQCGVAGHLNLLASPENLLYRTAYAFNAGDLLSVVLKNDGKIHWGWVVKWEFPEPDQESIVTLIRNLNALRKRHPEFLRYGRMLQPLQTVTGEKYTLSFQRGDVAIDAFLHSSWQAPDESRAQIITNFLPCRQTVFRNGVPIEIEALNAVILREKADPDSNS